MATTIPTERGRQAVAGVPAGPASGPNEGRRSLRFRRTSHPGLKAGTFRQVIVDHGKPDDPAWARVRDLERIVIKFSGGWWDASRFSRGPLRYLRAIAHGSLLWWRTRQHAAEIPIVTYGHEHGFVCAFWQWLFRPVKVPRVHFMFDLLLLPPRAGLTGLFDRMKMKIFDKAVAGAFVWGKADVVSFARWYNLSESKFIFQPYHTTLQTISVRVRDDGYIFAGGNSARDYATVIAALRTSSLPTIIATTLPYVAAMASSHPQITVRAVSEQEFRDLLAGCAIFVEAHDPAFPRTAGHQTMLNAMACGKPVVIADQVSAEWYVRDGEDGLVVPAGDAGAMRQAVNRLLNSPELRRRLSTAACRRISEGQFDIVSTMGRIYRHALTLDPAASQADEIPGIGISQNSFENRWSSAIDKS